MREHPIEIADAERAKHENRHVNPRLAQHDPLFDVSAREHHRPRLRQRPRHRRGAMPVGVRLDDRNDTRCRGATRGEEISDGAEVRLDCIQVDAGDGGTYHLRDGKCAMKNNGQWAMGDGRWAMGRIVEIATSIESAYCRICQDRKSPQATR